MVFGGSCLAKIDGKTVFVEGALPHETVEITLFETKKDYNKAYVTNVLKASPNRMHANCAIYNECGGCNLQHARYDYQIALKKEIIIDCLTRNKIDTIPVIETVSSTNTEYRNRFQFSHKGLKAKRSNNIIPLDDCLCAVKEIREFIRSKDSDILQHHERLQVFASDELLEQTSNHSIAFGIEGESEVCLQLLDTKIYFDVRGFFQSNIAMLKKTIPLVVKDLQGENLLDMYSGVGTLSLFAKDAFKTISLVEHNKKALQYAKKNYDTRADVTTFAMSGEQWVKKAKKLRYDALIIDPPRSGIEKAVRNWMCNEKIKTIRYLSCDVSTLARDAKALVDAGYTFESLFFLDYYPNTSHIESLACFTYDDSIVKNGSIS